MVQSLIPPSFCRSLLKTSLPLYLSLIPAVVPRDPAAEITDLLPGTFACCLWWSPPKINPVDLVQPLFVRTRIRSRVEIREAVGTGIEPRGIYRYPKSP